MNGDGVRGAVLGLFQWCLSMLSEAGVWAVLAAAFALGLVLLASSAAERVLKVIGRAMAVWARIPRTGRWMLGGVAVWLVAPWRLVTGDLLVGVAPAVTVGAYVTWWTWGWSLSRRYRLGQVAPWKAVRHHLRTVVARQHLDTGLRRATGATQPLIETVQVVDGGETAILLPPDGMSAAALAERINDGSADSALIRAGLGPIATGTATVTADGRVRVAVAHSADDDTIDLRATIIPAQEIQW